MSLQEGRDNAVTLELIRPDWNAPGNVIALTTSRSGGYSSGNYAGFNLATHVGDDPDCVARNRRLLAAELGGQLDFQWLDQVHGTDTVRAGRGELCQRADAAITSEPGLACCVLTADCLPVFFTTVSGAAVAVAHAGWRGLAAGILERTLASFTVPASDILAWLGPAIGPCHFEVGEEVREAFLVAADSRDREALAECFRLTDKPGKYLADLYRLARIRLERQGVTSIGGGGFCTYCQADRFYSYRRQPESGRMASLIYLKP